MAEVISDTSPLQYLHQAGLLHLLPALYRQVIIPEAVAAEIARGRAQGIDLPDLGAIAWMTRRTTTRAIPAPPKALGSGELEAIALAVNLAPDALLIIDDGEGRRLAQHLGVQITGTAGVLLAAKSVGLLHTVQPSLELLQRFGFYLTPKMRQHILTMAGE